MKGSDIGDLKCKGGGSGVGSRVVVRGRVVSIGARVMGALRGRDGAREKGVGV